MKTTCDDKICKYYETCPSSSGWCLLGGPTVRCVEFLITANEHLMSMIKSYQKQLSAKNDKERQG